MTSLIIVVIALMQAVNTIINIVILRLPPMPSVAPKVAVLIPARNEAANIGPCVDAALASRGADVEVIVLDDGSTDDTAAIVRSRSAADPRVRLESAPPLPAGWKGKTHACEALSRLTDKPFLLFVDADVRLAPEAAARLAPADGIDLVSGVPRQEVHGLVETAVVPMINSLILGYLPIAFMRLLPTSPPFAAACGQLMMVRADAYRAAGGHGPVANSMHDGLMLARHFRRSGRATDLVDATTLATCRMYDGASAVWNGFSKNATEGMARPVALPIWTALLGGGVLFPLLVDLVALAAPGAAPLALALSPVTLMLFFVRALQALKCGEPLRAILLYPVGVAITLAIQWVALFGAMRGRTVEWRGRSYAPTL